jgi:hypothetical protein
MRAAGPGKFNARLRMRRPLSGWMDAFDEGAFAICGYRSLECGLLGMIEAIMQPPSTCSRAKRFH